MAKCFFRGRSVVLKPQSVLVLSSSNNHMPEKVLWTLPNQAHSGIRDEQPGPTTLLSTAIWLAFCFVFRASEEMSDSPSCSIWLLPAKKGVEVPYTWELSNLVWSRLNAQARSISHLSGSARDLVFSPLRSVPINVLIAVISGCVLKTPFLSIRPLLLM